MKNQNKPNQAVQASPIVSAFRAPRPFDLLTMGAAEERARITMMSATVAAGYAALVSADPVPGSAEFHTLCLMDAEYEPSAAQVAIAMMEPTAAIEAAAF